MEHHKPIGSSAGGSGQSQIMPTEDVQTTGSAAEIESSTENSTILMETDSRQEGNDTAALEGLTSEVNTHRTVDPTETCSSSSSTLPLSSRCSCASFSTVSSASEEKDLYWTNYTPGQFYPGDLGLSHVSSAHNSNAALMYSSTFLMLPTSASPAGGSLKTFALAVGAVGATMGVAGLVAYLIVQVPIIREQIGTYSWLSESSNATSEVKGSLPASQVAYAYEMAIVLISTCLAILANVLLIYGSSRGSSAFVVPWLVCEALFIVVLLVAAALVLALARPLEVRAAAVVPVVAAAVAAFCWKKVFSLHSLLRKDQLWRRMLLGQPLHWPHRPQWPHWLRLWNQREDLTANSYRSYDDL